MKLVFVYITHAGTFDWLLLRVGGNWLACVNIVSMYYLSKSVTVAIVTRTFTWRIKRFWYCQNTTCPIWIYAFNHLVLTSLEIDVKSKYRSIIWLVNQEFVETTHNFFMFWGSFLCMLWKTFATRWKTSGQQDARVEVKLHPGKVSQSGLASISQPFSRHLSIDSSSLGNQSNHWPVVISCTLNPFLLSLSFPEHFFGLPCTSVFFFFFFYQARPALI